MSSWGKKLQSKLDALSNASSKESCQALAKWIGFNRKQLSAHFVSVLVQALQSTKQPVILNVLNETLLLERDNVAKWDKLGDVRLAVGEQVLLPSVTHLSQVSKDKVLGWLGTDWEEAGVFGERPTFGEQLRRALKSTTATAETAEAGDGGGADSAQDVDNTSAALHAVVAAPASSPAGEEGESQASVIVSKAPTSETYGPKTSSSSPKRGASKISKGAASSPTTPAATTAASEAAPSTTGDSHAAAAAVAAPFDFESRGIPPADVDPDDLLRHSRQIATLQIGRDLRNDNAVQLSSLLASLPSEVRALLQPKEGQDDNEDNDPANLATIALDDETARNLSDKVNPALLDMDLDEQLQDVLHFRELVLKQQMERKKLIELLIASRCNFGAHDAASAFSKADRSMAELVERRQVLLDAMELEGLDVATEEEAAAAKDVMLDELPPLAWYRPEAEAAEDEEEHDAKRQKLRCVVRSRVKMSGSRA